MGKGLVRREEFWIRLWGVGGGGQELGHLGLG